MRSRAMNLDRPSHRPHSIGRAYVGQPDIERSEVRFAAMTIDHVDDTPSARAAVTGRADEDDLLLDRIDALRVLRADSDEEKGRLLEEIGGSGKPEQDIVVGALQGPAALAPGPLRGGAPAGHALARGARPQRRPRRPRCPRLGPLTPVAQWAVQQVNRWIVKSHQNTLIDRIRKLYERREANAVWGSAEHRMLRRARHQRHQDPAGADRQAARPAHLPRRRRRAVGHLVGPRQAASAAPSTRTPAR